VTIASMDGIAERRFTMRPLRHAHCPGCYPEGGELIPTLCGASKTAKPGVTDVTTPPPDACMVCADLVYIPCKVCGWHW